MNCPSDADIIKSLKICADLESNCKGCVCEKMESFVADSCTCELMRLAAERLQNIAEVAGKAQSLIEEKNRTISQLHKDIAFYASERDWGDD